MYQMLEEDLKQQIHLDSSDGQQEVMRAWREIDDNCYYFIIIFVLLSFMIFIYTINIILNIL